MKIIHIKNLLPFFCTSFFLIFSTSVFLTNLFGQYNHFSTTSQFCAYTLKTYFSSISPMPEPNQNQTRSQSSNKSKTSIFNQSLINYIKEVYNNRQYPHRISQDGTHIVEFLELGSELNLDLKSFYTCMRLFYNKIKECELIDDTVIIQILKPLPFLIEKYFNLETPQIPSLAFLTQKIDNFLVLKFTDHLPEFQANPNTFLGQLSQDLALATQKEMEIFNHGQEENVMMERFRQIIIKFLELAISKLIWDRNAYEGIWDSVITLANNVQILANQGIIDHADDLDDLLWSITHRFCFFLELVGSTFPLSFYTHIENDLNSKIIAFLEANEQDVEIKSKKTFIAEALLKAKAKACAFEKGIISDQRI